jgi:N-acetyltransferase 10
VSLNMLHAGILLNLGLLYKSVTDVEAELKLPSQQVLALFNKTIRKITTAIRALQTAAEEASLTKDIAAKQKADRESSAGSSSSRQGMGSLDKELAASGDKVSKELKRKQQELLSSIDLQQYAVGGTDADWEGALDSSGPKANVSLKKKDQGPAEPKKGGGKDKGGGGGGDKGQKGDSAGHKHKKQKKSHDKH